MKSVNEQLKESITIINGPLAGMTFIVEDHTPVENGRVKVKYVAPNNGPRAYVEHFMNRNEFCRSNRAEDVRIAFSKLIPASVLWSKEKGYTATLSGNALEWNRYVSRFVTRKEQKAPALRRLIGVLNAKVEKGNN